MRTRATGTLALVVLSAALGAAACSSSSTGAAQPVQDAAPARAPDGADTDTWVSWGAGFFTKYCVECHDAADPKGLNFGDQAAVVANRDAIRCGVCVSQDPAWGCPAVPPAKQFPISDPSGSNPKPTDAERDRVVDWIAAGAR